MGPCCAPVTAGGQAGYINRTALTWAIVARCVPAGHTRPVDFIARLATLVLKPRVNLTRFHGVFAPNCKHRALVTPAKRGKGNKAKVSGEPPTPAERRASMTWAQRLKRVFNIDIETCRERGGAVKVIAYIEDPVVIRKIRDHLKE